MCGMLVMSSGAGRERVGREGGWERSIPSRQIVRLVKRRRSFLNMSNLVNTGYNCQCQQQNVKCKKFNFRKPTTKYIEQIALYYISCVNYVKGIAFHLLIRRVR